MGLKPCLALLVLLPRRIDRSIAQGFGFVGPARERGNTPRLLSSCAGATEPKNKRATGQYALGAALICICSCSLDTTPDISPASVRDASVSPPQWQQASLRYDAPREPRTDDSVKRNLRDDSDAGDDAKPPIRDAGRPASARPAAPPARDAGSVDAGIPERIHALRERAYC